MIGRVEIERSLTGAWRLFMAKPDALRFFDTSIEGFWRSFQVIVLVVPVYFVTALSEQSALSRDATPDAAFDATGFWLTQAVTLAVDWVTLPLLLAALASWIGIKREYPAYIVVRNWASVLTVLPFAAVSVLENFGVGEDILLIPSLAALAFSLRFGYLIARRTLNVGVEVAVALVALDVLVSLAVVKIIGKVSGFDALG